MQGGICGDVRVSIFPAPQFDAETNLTWRYCSAMLQSPSWRKPAGVALILLLIVIWTGLVATLSAVISHWPVIAQAPFYVVMGIIWIIPLKPLIRWMETGRWRGSSERPD